MSSPTAVRAAPKSWWCRLRQCGQDRGTALHVFANFDHRPRAGRQQNIAARAKLDQAYALATFHALSRAAIEDDAPRQQAGNLFENDRMAVIAAQAANTLLVQLRRDRAHGVVKLALAIFDAGDHARDRRAVDMNIENIKKNADAQPLRSLYRHQRDVRHFAIGGRNHRAGGLRNHSFRVAEEP